MDANGTRYQLLLGYDDWAACLDAHEVPLGVVWETLPGSSEPEHGNLQWDAPRYELTLRSRVFQFTAAPRDTPPRLDDRRGAGRDRYGNWYWIDEQRRAIRASSAGTGATAHFWAAGDGVQCAPTGGYGDFAPDQPAPPPAPGLLSGLAVTEDHYLVVGVLDPPGLLIFDLHAGGPPRQLGWPDAVPFVPFDMAPAPGGGVWILDRVNACYWALDRRFGVIRQDQATVALAPAEDDPFQPTGGGSVRRRAARSFPAGITLHAASPLVVGDPIAIEALPDGTVLILDRNPGRPFSLIYHYHFRRQLGAPVSTEVLRTLIEDEDRSRFRLAGHDLAFVSEHDTPGGKVCDRLYIVAADGNQTYAANLARHGEQIVLDPLPEYLPMRLFGGKGLVGAGGAAYYDFDDFWIPLVAQRRPRYAPTAILYTPLNVAPRGSQPPDLAAPRHAFDGRERDCVWHRLMLDACIPPDTKVGVWSRAANSEADLLHTAWQREPSLYLRANGASELPFVGRPPAPGSAPLGAGTWELLLQQARGQYLQLMLELQGNEQSTPRLRALRVYYPRFSYLNHYLPAVYREEPQSASFLDRFLANLEGCYTNIEDKIAAVQMLFDVRSAPADTLEWLARWFGVALDPAWDEATRRLFIRHAMDFFQYRGTIRGLLMALRLIFEGCADEAIFTDPLGTRQARTGIRVVERYRTRRTPGVVFGDPTDPGGPRLVARTGRWQPDQGPAGLHQSYVNFIAPPGLPAGATTTFPTRLPADPAAAAAWARFVEDTLGFVPVGTAADQEHWLAFVAGHSPLGAAPLYQWYADFLAPPDPPAGQGILFPLRAPAQPAAAAAWQRFAQNTLGFVPAAARSDEARWHDFLARRYGRIGALNDAYRRTEQQAYAGFTVVPLPRALPADAAPLLDWYQFEGVVLAMQRTAHRFTVLLPVPAAAARGAEEQQRRLDLAQRVIDLEKPAHTVFDVRFYWAMFRLGEARLSTDTLIDRGGRAPELLPPLVLGQGYLVESYLAPGHPQNVAERQILGRERLGG